MIDEQPACDQFVILADESADWKIAGLRQLNRLVLALNEFAGATHGAGQLVVTVFWKSDVRPAARCLPNGLRLTRVRLTESFASPAVRARIVSTRLFVYRNALAEFFGTTSRVQMDARTTGLPEVWRQLSDEFERACRDANVPEKGRVWQFIRLPNEIAAAEDGFLRRAGKSQDGLVSRWINRPLTRPLTRLLLKLPIEPTAWTLSIVALPVLSCVFLLRGDYASMVIGTGIYQLYSMLDGCDGEIARAKFLESKRGGRVDDLCDIIGAFLFVIGLGFGLCRSHAPAPNAWLYAAEGVLLAALIAGNEWALRIPEAEANPTPATFAQAAYPRHRRLIQRAGLSRFGETFVWCVLQVTKRDVGILFFPLLAVAGLSQWILHPWLLVTVMTLVLNALSHRNARS